MLKNPRVSYKSDTIKSESQDANGDANKNWKVQFDTISTSFDFIHSWFGARLYIYFLFRISSFSRIHDFIMTKNDNVLQRDVACSRKNNRQNSAPKNSIKSQSWPPTMNEY